MFIYLNSIFIIFKDGTPNFTSNEFYKKMQPTKITNINMEYLEKKRVSQFPEDFKRIQKKLL